MTIDEGVEGEERGPASSSASLQGLALTAAVASGAADDAVATGNGDGDALPPSADGSGGLEIGDERASPGEDGGAADVVVGSAEGDGGRRGEERGSDSPSAAPAPTPVQAVTGAAGERRGSSVASEVMVSPMPPPAEPVGLSPMGIGGVGDEEKGCGSSRSGGNAGGEPPLSLSDSRHSGGDFSDDVSDWDRSLRSLTSPPPGSPELLVEGAPDPSQLPLMRRLSTAMLIAPQALKGTEEAADTVTGEPNGGGRASCLRRPSFGPLLFTPAGLAEQARASITCCPEATTATSTGATPGLSSPSAAGEPSERHASPRAAVPLTPATEIGGKVLSADGGSPGGGHAEGAGSGPVAAAVGGETTESATGVGSAAAAAGGGGREESRRKGTGGSSRIRTISRRIYQRSTEEVRCFEA